MKLPKDWTQNKRETGLIEWVCPHGIGHPAPAEYQIYAEMRKSEWNVHGCDGCCAVYSNHYKSKDGKDY
jgi:hypothetical protein